MRFFTLFAGTLVATTAANILLASDAYAGFPPNGWSQVGQGCRVNSNGEATDIGGTQYHKLRKNSDSSKYGVYRNQKNWQQKGITLSEADDKMNEKCNCTKLYGGISLAKCVVSYP